MDGDYQKETDCHSKDYANDLFIQKLSRILEVPPVPGRARNPEVREKETEPPNKVALGLPSTEWKQNSLALFASGVDKWRVYSRLSRIIICSLILLSFIMATAAFVTALLKCFPSCPDGWKYFNEKCYSYSSEKNVWNNTRRLCQERDADLVVINHEEEQDFLVYMMSSKEVHWIGLSDLEKEGTWKWVDGTSNYTNWYTGEPKNDLHRAVEDCAVLQKEHNFMWNALPCDNNYRYICEKSMQLACVWQTLCISP